MVNCGLTPSEGIWDLESGIWNLESGMWNQGHTLLGDCGIMEFGIQTPRLSWIPYMWWPYITNLSILGRSKKTLLAG